jgi:hypothetical protein
MYNHPASNRPPWEWQSTRQHAYMGGGVVLSVDCRLVYAEFQLIASEDYQ